MLREKENEGEERYLKLCGLLPVSHICGINRKKFVTGVIQKSPSLPDGPFVEMAGVEKHRQ